jgi:hypothetical protein
MSRRSRNIIEMGNLEKVNVGDISLNYVKRCKIFAGRVDLQVKTDAVSFP